MNALSQEGRTLSYCGKYTGPEKKTPVLLQPTDSLWEPLAEFSIEERALVVSSLRRSEGFICFL